MSNLRREIKSVRPEKEEISNKLELNLDWYNTNIDSKVQRGNKRMMELKKERIVNDYYTKQKKGRYT